MENIKHFIHNPYRVNDHVYFSMASRLDQIYEEAFPFIDKQISWIKWSGHGSFKKQNG